MTTQQTLIIGASSDIGMAIAEQVQADKNTGLLLISRNFKHADLQTSVTNSPQVTKIRVKDYQPQIGRAHV